MCAVGFPGSGQISDFGHPRFASPAEKYTRLVEGRALLERRRHAGERAMADAREAQERWIARERWEREHGVPMGRGVTVKAGLGKGKEKEKEQGKGGHGHGDVEMLEQAQADVEAEEEEVDIPGGYAPEDAYAEDKYGQMRRRSPLCIVSVATAASPPSPLVLDSSPSPTPAQGVEEHQNPEMQAQAGSEQGPRTDLVYEVAPQLPPYDQPSREDDLGPDPATRAITGWGPWKVACRTRVWDVQVMFPFLAMYDMMLISFR
jgi:hypothetical protein